MNSTAAASLIWPSPLKPDSRAIAKVSIGRSLLPPDESGVGHLRDHGYVGPGTRQNDWR